MPQRACPLPVCIVGINYVFHDCALTKSSISTDFTFLKSLVPYLDPF